MMDIKAIIEKLNNIDVKDFQNIDAHQVKKIIRENREVVINILIVVVSCVILFYVWSGYGRKMKRLSREKTELIKKIELFDKYESVRKKYTTMVRSFPKGLSRDQLIDKVSDMAMRYGIQMLSFSPVQEKEDALSTIVIMNIKVEAQDYASMVRFIEALEKERWNIKVQGWKNILTGNSRRQRTSSGGSENEDVIRAEIKVASERLKNARI